MLIGDHAVTFELLWVYFAKLCALCDVQDAQMPQAHGCAGAVGK